MRARDRTQLRRQPHSIEWLIDKWTKRIWKAHALYSDKGDCVLPSFLRKEFEVDIRLVFEKLYKDVEEKNSLWKPPYSQDIHTDIPQDEDTQTFYQRIRNVSQTKR